MSVFLDASAIVALIAGETEADRIAARLSDQATILSSPLARWEAIIGLRRSHRYEWSAAREAVDALFVSRSVRIVPIGEAEGQMALSVWANYGKGNHPASLNLGDCFAAACAATHEAWLIFKGNDFSQIGLGWIDRA